MPFKKGDLVRRSDGKPFNSSGKITHTVEKEDFIGRVHFVEASAWMWTGELKIASEPPKIVQAFVDQKGKLHPTEGEMEKANLGYKKDELRSKLYDILDPYYPKSKSLGAYLSVDRHAYSATYHIVENWDKIKTLMERELK